MWEDFVYQVEHKDIKKSNEMYYPRTMDTIIDQQVVIDEALVPHARRLRIGRSNFYLLSDISSKESTLQLVYDYEEEEASEEDKKGEEHLAPIDFTTLLAIDPIPSAEDTKAFETDKTRKTVRLSPPMAASTEALIVEFASAPTPPSPPPSPLSPCLTYADAPLGYRAAMVRSRDASPLHVPSPPLFFPSTAHRDDILEADIPLWKRLYLTTPTSRFEVEESSSAAARQTGHTLACSVDYGFIDTMDASICASESSVMTGAWSYSEDMSMTLEASIRTLEAQVRTLQTQHEIMESQRQQAGDMVTSAFGRIHALEARDRARPDYVEEIGVVNALAEYEAHRRSGNGDDSHNSGSCRKTERATQLALMCGRVFLEESDEVKKYVSGLPDMIQGSVMASKPKTMQDAIKFATKLMD
nr:hypothetical protein [Tanacetum cinerariifolium]